MKYLFVLLTLGALTYTTYAAPASSNIQQDDTDQMNEKEFLNLISRVAKTSQSDDDDYTSAEAQFWQAFLRPVLKHAGGYLLNKALGGGKSDEKEFLNRVAKVSQSDDDDNDDTLAEAQGWWGIIRGLIRNKKVRKYAGKAVGGLLSHLIPQQDNGAGENAVIEDDDDDDEGDSVMAEAENDALVQTLLEKLMERDSELKAAIESLPEEARSQFLFSVGLPLLGSLLASKLG